MKSIITVSLLTFGITSFSLLIYMSDKAADVGEEYNKLESKYNESLAISREQRNEIKDLKYQSLGDTAALHEAFDKLEALELQNERLQNKNENLQSENNKLKKEASQWQTFKLTYYDANEPSTGKKPGDPAYGITASGRKVKSGITIAVDPKVIPLDSWVLIKWPDGKIERRRADDTGRLIKGQHIDYYVPRATLAMGVSKVEVKVIEN